MDASLRKEVIRLAPISQRLLNQQPANPSLTSEATGRVFFKSELLGLGSKNKNKINSQIEEETKTEESIPIYKDGDSLRGSVTIYQIKSKFIYASFLWYVDILKSTEKCR